MSTVMSATEARVHFGEVLRRVENNETVTVERGGQPKAVILSVEEYEKLKADHHQKESWEERLIRARDRYLREVVDPDYDVEENETQMREERSDELYEGLH